MEGFVEGYLWAVFGGFGVILTLIAWWCALKERKFAQLAAWGSSFCTAFTSVMAYAMVVEWIEKEDWSAAMDVAPTMYKCLILYTLVLMASNLDALLYGCRRK